MGRYESFRLSENPGNQVSYKSQSGCFMKLTTGLVLISVAVVIAIGVGLIVHFTDKDHSTSCDKGRVVLPGQPTAEHGDNRTTFGPDELTKKCKTMATKDDAGICQSCPHSTCPVHVSTAAPPTNAAQTPAPPTNAAQTPAPPTKTVETPVPPITFTRLPKSVLPVQYDLEMTPNMYGPDPDKFTFNGTVNIKLKCKTETDNIILHSNHIIIAETKLTAEVVTEDIKIKDVNENTIQQLLTFTLNKNLIPEHVYYLRIKFYGPLKKDLRGLYLSSYQQGGSTRYLATTQFQPTDARKAFPCFDEPGFKAAFHITVLRKQGWHSLSNSPLSSSEDRNGMTADIFEPTFPMSTYLVAMVVSKFGHSTGKTVNNITYGAWAKPDSVPYTQEALRLGIDILTYYEQLFDIPFPLKKQDMIAIPDYPLGGMENWGLVTYREEAMLFNPQTNSEYSKQRVTKVIAHELSHQWFGDLVTMQWWDDLWLNEGFATYMEYVGTNFSHPDWNIFDQFTIGDLYAAFEFDGHRSSHPIYVPVSTPVEIGEIFDHISYAKGGSVIRMLRYIIGEDTFNAALTVYLKELRYGTAEHNILFEKMNEQAQKDGISLPFNVKAILDPWILQMNYPVVKVTRSEGGRLSLEQKRFLMDDSETTVPDKYNSTFGYTWVIPFTYTTSKEVDFNKQGTSISWLNTHTKELEIKDTTDSSSSASYLDLNLSYDNNGHLSAKIYDKRDDLNFSIVNFPFLRNITDPELPSPSDKNSWVLANLQQYGLYRVNYDTDNWLALVKQLKTDYKTISIINRGQIIDDAWNLARAGELDIEIALATVEYLDQELEYVPWVAAKAQLNFLDKLLSKTEAYGLFQEFMKMKVTGPYEKVGLTNSKSTHMESLFRSEIVQTACGYGLEACVKDAKNLYRSWMDDPDNNPIPPAAQQSVYCTAIAEGDWDAWSFAFERLKTTIDVAQIAIIQNALACSKEPWILRYYLNLSLNSSYVRSQDTLTVIEDVANNQIGNSFAWDFLIQHWQYIRTSFGGAWFSFDRLAKYLTQTSNTDNDLNKLNNFVNGHTNLGTGNTAFSQAVENTKSRIKFMNKNFHIIKSWLQKVTTSPKPAVVKDVRLPHSLKPTHYELELKPDMYGDHSANFRFYGKVKIHMDCTVATANITLHAHKLTIDEKKVIVTEQGQTTLEGVGVRRLGYDVDRQFVIVYLSKELEAGKTYILSMDFDGPLTDDMTGLYLSSYNRGNRTIYLATTQMEPTDARKAFPCFDEPAMKATFQVTLLRKPHMMSLSNMPLIKTESRSDGFKADVHQTSKKMSTYLLAFVISDFQGKTAPTKHNITYGVWARPESLGQIDLALETGIQTLTYYEDFFGIDFPLPKQDMIAIPDFAAGAMENWGLITYRENSMLYKKGLSSTSDKQWTTETITHELAHQWFGDLVTMKWWDDLWLNEGFATFVQYLGAGHMHPDWKMFDQFVVKEVQDSMEFDGLISSHPMYAPVHNPAQINEIFDAISYSKGASIIRMMRFFVGKETFKKGIKKYLQISSYANAVHDDLWYAMSNQTHTDGHPVDVKSIMDTWTLQMNYPVVMVTNLGNGKIKLTQKRYLRNPDAKDPGRFTSKYGYTWIVPVTITTSHQPNFNQDYRDVRLFGGLEEERPLQSNQRIPDGGWFLANVLQYGYYRVNYEDKNWRALIRQLVTDHQVIHLVNRAQIINDAWALAKSGDLSMDIALDTLPYLGEEVDYVPWSAATVELSYVEKMLVRTPLYGKFKKFMKQIVQKPYTKLGMDNSNSGHMESKARSVIVATACDNGVTECQTAAKTMFSDWMTRPDRNTIDPDVKQTVMCTGIDEGGADEWEFLYTRYKQSNVANEKRMMMYALACSRETWILQRYLEMSLDPNEIRKQDTDYVIRYVSANTIGRDLTWNFMQEKWPVFLERYGGGSFSFTHMISATLESFNTDLELDQIKAFKEANPDMGSGTRAFEQGIEKAEGNVRWMRRNYDVVKRWLDDAVEPETVRQVVDVRLPRTLLPTLYELEIFPDFYKPNADDFTFTGTAKIHISCFEASTNITLHTNKLTVDATSVKVMTASGGAPSVVNTTHDDERQFLIVHLDADLLAMIDYTLEMRFSGPLKDDLVGLYYSTYLRGGQEVYIATTQMEPTDARKAFPCFDEPNMKAQFKVTVVRRADLISLSNMQILTSEVRPGGMVADIYDVSPVMSTYLVAIVVCDFAYISRTTTNGITYGALAPKEMIDQAKFALDVGVDTITLYEKFFDIKFPLKKQEMIAIPDFAAGAMENWGLITYRETAMLYEPGVSSAANKQRVTVVVTHELAHQWFGDLVTLDWWDDLWLNEGFATFVEYLGGDNKFPDWNFFDIFTIEELHDAFSFDALVTSHPLFVPVSNPDQINEVFDSISYSKGGSVIRMMRFFVGDRTFQLGLQRYLKKRAYKNANHDDLWTAIQEQVTSEGRDIQVKAIMDTWILQMNYPVVMVTKINNNEVRVTQERFLTNPNATDPGRYVSPFNYTWRIPVTITHKSDVNFNQTYEDGYWHDNKEDVITLKNPMVNDDWFLANVQQYGFYRVNYDDVNWNALTSQLKLDHKVFHNVNRGQLVNDAWNLAHAGEVSLKIALDMLDYLTEERDYVPWQAALTQLHYANVMLMRTELYGDFTAAIRRLITKPFESVGLHPNITDGHLTSMLRISMSATACGYGIESCVKLATDMFQEWIVDPANNIIHPDVKQAIYCTGVAEGGVLEWDFLYSQYKTSNNAAEKKRILYALSCSKEPWILTRYLEKSLDPVEVRKQDASSVMTYVAGHSIGRDLAWNFVRANWQLLMMEFGGGTFSFSSLIAGVTKSFNTEFDLQQLREFREANPDMGSGNRAYEQAIEKTESNILWIKDNFEILRSWLGDGVEEKGEVTDVRLPRSVLPSLYELTIFPDFYKSDPKDFTYNGTITIHVTCVEATNNITLHVNQLTILEKESIKLVAATGIPVPDVVKITHDYERQFLILELDGELRASTNYSFGLRYRGDLKDDMTGIYYSSYERGNDTVYMATTQLEPTDARKAFPCFDEPNIKARFQITVVRHAGRISLSNMQIERTETLPTGYAADHYYVSPIMSTYLVAIVVCDFAHINRTTTNGIYYGALAPREMIDQAKFALDVGVDTITLYEDFFGINFPLKKQEMIAIPDFAAGAMENWGLITYRETAMLFEPGVSSAANKQRVTTVITHELAHQWFGNLVTMDWWDDLWLNEGFATFVEHFGADHKFPDWNYFDIFTVEQVQDAFDFDALVTSHPLFAPVYNPDQINEVFDSISYSKGASVIRMMRFFVGEKTFQLGLQRYLKEREYKNAKHDDLWAAMSRQVTSEGRDLDVKAIMDTWILQMNYPVVMVTKMDNTHVQVTQKRFLTNPNAKDTGRFVSPFRYTWKIPITVTYKSDTNFNQSDSDVYWHDNEIDVLTLRTPMQNGDWFLANVQQFGFYRVNYADDNWALLSQQLKTDHKVFHTINRGQLINDAWNLANAGELPLTIALDLADYLTEERDYVPWKAALSQLYYIDSMLMRTELYGQFVTVVRNLVTKPYGSVGLHPKASDRHLDNMLRISLSSQACGYGVDTCVRAAKQMFQEWMTNPDNNMIPPDVKQAVYCTGVSGGGVLEWDFLYSQYKTSNNAAEKKRILYALTCSTEPWILSRYLEWSIDAAAIRKQDARYVMTTLSGHAAGRDLAWNFVRANWDRMVAEFGGGFFFGDLITGVTGSFNTEFDLKQLLQFKKDNPDMGAGTRAFQQALEKTEANILWIKNNRQIIRTWLDNKVKGR